MGSDCNEGAYVEVGPLDDEDNVLDVVGMAAVDNSDLRAPLRKVVVQEAKSWLVLGPGQAEAHLRRLACSHEVPYLVASVAGSRAPQGVLDDGEGASHMAVVEQSGYSWSFWSRRLCSCLFSCRLKPFLLPLQWAGHLMSLKVDVNHHWPRRDL